jgi:hypothetical protein
MSEFMKSGNTTLILELVSKLFRTGGSIQAVLGTTIPGFEQFHGYILRKWKFNITRLLSFAAAGTGLVVLYDTYG